MAQMFPVDAGNDPETVRRHTLTIGADLRDQAALQPDTTASAIAVTLDSAFIRSCEDGERHLEGRGGNVETEAGQRQVFGIVAKADTDIKVLIHRSLDAVGRTADTVLTALHALNGYLTGQGDWLINYVPWHPAGLRVATAITEGTANFLVNRRMNKSQQMRWSRRGADLLLQVRCAVHNGTLGSGFGQRSQPANDPLPQSAVAA